MDDAVADGGSKAGLLRLLPRGRRKDVVPPDVDQLRYPSVLLHHLPRGLEHAGPIVRGRLGLILEAFADRQQCFVAPLEGPHRSVHRLENTVSCARAMAAVTGKPSIIATGASLGRSWMSPGRAE